MTNKSDKTCTEMNSGCDRDYRNIPTEGNCGHLKTVLVMFTLGR
jgi:hypothetical protein